MSRPIINVDRRANPHPVDSTTRACCDGIGGHTPHCRLDDYRDLVAEADKHHAEAVDLLIELAWMNGIQA